MASLEASSRGSNHASVLPSNQPELWLAANKSLSVTRTSFFILLGLTTHWNLPPFPSRALQILTFSALGSGYVWLALSL